MEYLWHFEILRSVESAVFHDRDVQCTFAEKTKIFLQHVLILPSKSEQTSIAKIAMTIIISEVYIRG